MPDSIVVFIIVLFAVFVHASIGFGVALVSMPILATTIGLTVATPLVTLIAFTIRTLILVRYREIVQPQKIWRLMLAVTLGIPVGFWISQEVDGRLVERSLGIIVTGYALFALTNPRLPEFRARAWTYSLGTISGILSGAYNIGGPPLVIYATGQRWPPALFKSHLQGFAFVSGCLVLGTRALDGEYTSTVLGYYWIILPAIVLGLLAGFWLDRYIPPKAFRKAVQYMLLVVGLQLVF
jgi:uncharacterized membrane protein YfcA